MFSFLLYIHYFGVGNLLKRTAIFLLFTGLGLILSINIYAFTRENEPVSALVMPEPSEAALARTETITLTAAGDCLMHNTQIWSGLQEDGTYSFDHFFTEVKDLIEEGDYSSIDFEAAMAGPASGYTGYPTFNSPDAMADALKNAGFDLVVTANNHVMDRGYKGALRTIEVLQNAGLDTLGVYKSEEDSKKFLIKDIRGVKVAYIAYTYGTNGIVVPQEHSCLVNMLDRDRILSDIADVRPQVDILVLVLHWGVEYSPQASEAQMKMAREFLEAGVDVILGSHPHVIQNMEIIRVDDKDKLVIYSMGNFIGHQIGIERNSGIVLKMKFSKDFEQDETILDEVSYIPTFSHPYYINGKRQFRVVPVEETIEKISEGEESILDSSDIPVLQTVLENTRKQLGNPFMNLNNQRDNKPEK